MQFDRLGEKKGADHISPKSPFLALKGLSRSFGTTVAVKDMNLTVGQGEYITLLGPSGCGKTTTLRMIAGFLAPQEGEIWLENENITALQPEKRPVNTVFQDYALFPHLTLRQNVEFGLRFREIPKDERKRLALQMLERVELRDLAERYPRYLSGGQQQRVALARALICQPRLLLLDEPLGALDARLREQMQFVLKDLQRSLNITFIHVTHDQMEAMALSDRIVVMRQGVIQQEGSPDELYYKPLNSFVADFLGITNLLHGTIVRQEGPTVIIDIGGIEIFSQAHEQLQVGEQVFLAIRPSAITVSDKQHDYINSFEGRVVGMVYRGDHWLVSIGMNSCESIFLALVSVAVQQGTGLLEGKSVNISWPIEDVWLMKD